MIASEAWADGGDKKLFIENENCPPAEIWALNTLLTVTVEVPISPTHCTDDFTFYNNKIITDDWLAQTIELAIGI